MSVESQTEGSYAAASIDDDDEDVSGEFTLEAGSIEGRAAKTVEEEKIWTWLQPEKDEKKETPDKFYLVKYKW